LNSTQAQDISAREWLLTGTGLGLSVGMEFYLKDHLVPELPRFTTPNQLDRGMRTRLWWGEARQDVARRWSDVLIYGVSMSSLLWGPAMASDFEEAFYINNQVFVINSILTNVLKVTAARERPYHYYGTRVPAGSKDFTSFYSGHSSVAFSQAVTNAMILSQHHPEYKSAIWSTLMGTAGMTAYLRVAGDMHYFSDILVGALSGSMVAWIITEAGLKRFEKDSELADLLIKTPSRGFTVSFKIPLG